MGDERSWVHVERSIDSSHGLRECCMVFVVVLVFTLLPVVLLADPMGN